MSPDWSRPSTFVLAAVLAANLALPVAHFWPADGGSATPAAVAAPARSRAATAARAPVATGRQTAGRQAVEPVDPPIVAKRVVHKPAPPVCRAWGPFTELTQAESVAAALELDPMDFEVFESQVRARPDYLVTVQASGSRRSAARIVEELRTQDVESYLLDRPGNVLAAGVFSNQARAEMLRRRLDELGYGAAIEPLDRSHRVYHLMARLPADREPAIPAAGACGDIAPIEQFL